MKKLLFILIICLLVTPVFAETYTVKRVVDGDILLLTNGERVHLIGIDTPEVHESDKLIRDAKRSGKDFETIIAMGKKASEFVKGLVDDKEVTLEFDVQERDKYGRLLAYVWYKAEDPTEDCVKVLPDGTYAPCLYDWMLNSEIIAYGYATPMTIPPNVKYAELFEKLYQEARENKRGLWKGGVPQEAANAHSQITEQSCDAYKSCPEKLECFSFPGIGTRCAKQNPCSYYKCSSNTQCVIAESYPSKVMCHCTGEGCSSGSDNTNTVSHSLIPLSFQPIHDLD